MALSQRRRRRETPANIKLTDEVVHAAARLRHRLTIHVIVYAADSRWRVVCNGDRTDTDDRYDLAVLDRPNCLKCVESINFDGAVRRRNGWWAY